MSGVTRREFLKTGTGALAGLAGLSVWIDPRRGLAQDPGRPLLVVIFLRGGADGLHLVPPIGDPAYRKLRGRLALHEALELDGRFGLHPGLADLAPLYQRGKLAIVHAAGSPAGTRSHFEAQDLMEAGTVPGLRVAGGWLGRAFGPAARIGAREDSGRFASLALTEQLPLTLRGSGGFAIDDPARFARAAADPSTVRMLERLYAPEADHDDPVRAAGREALAAVAELRSAEARGAARRKRGRKRGAVSRLTDRVEDLISLEQAGLGIRVVFLESDGWDSHSAQGAERGMLGRSIRDLGASVRRLVDGFGERRDLLVVALTEFGRTVRPNGAGGTDHGHGSAILVAGPRVRGGIYGAWPGLDAASLHEGRDLPVTTDYRSVLTEVLASQLGTRAASAAFPGFEPRSLSLLG